MFRALLLLATFISVNVYAQTLNQASISIGGSGADIGNSISLTNDNGYVISGSTTSFGNGGSDVYVVKTDSAGKIKWTSIVGGSNDDYGYSLVKTYDKGFAVTGYTTSYGNGGGGIYILKLNSIGKLLWSKTIEGQSGYSIIEAKDKGFAIAGYYKACSACPKKAYIIKLDSLGNEQWSQTIGGTLNDTAYSIVQTNDQGFAVAGVTSSFGVGGNDVWLIKLDKTGNVQWTKTIGGAGNDEAYSVIQTTDKGYALAGITSSFGAGSNDMYVIKTDSSGNLQWTRTIGGPNNDIAKSIVQADDGSYVVTGTTYFSLPGQTSVYAIKLDSAGNLKWNYTHRAAASALNCIIKTGNGYLAAGETTLSGGAGGNDMYILRFDTAGDNCSATNASIAITSIDSGRVSTGGKVISYTPIVSIDTSATDTGGISMVFCTNSVPTQVPTVSMIKDKVIVFPDPAKDNISIRYESENVETLCIRIIDMAGNILYTSFNNSAFIGSNNYNIGTSSLAEGMYILEIQTSKKTIFEKFVKQ